MRYTVSVRWGKKLIRMLLGDEDKFILHDRIDDLLAFTPEANSRIEKYLKSIVSVNIASTEHVSDEQRSTVVQDCIDSLVDRLQDHLVGDRDNLLKEGRLNHAENLAREPLEKLGWTQVPREALAAEPDRLNRNCALGETHEEYRS